ncbi:PPK2 family polyphosphate kinase [Leucobacter sp. HY1908]
MGHHKFWTSDVTELLRVGEGFSLNDIDPGATPGTEATKHEGAAELERAEQPLRELQEKLFACSWEGSKKRVLVVLQAMDAAGKGGIVNHLFGALEPYGLALSPFKAPTAEEREHDFLWRVEKRVPKPGVIGLFDRSHYEDVLIQKVHEWAPADEIERRYAAICEFEARLANDGVEIVKIMLHISPDEQIERLLSRLDEPYKHWKFSPDDVTERTRWPEYMAAFQTAIERTNAPHAPWYVVPANNKWYARVAVQRIVTSRLEQMGLDWPDVDYDIGEQRARLEATRELRWP